jgi:hypothetical protein
VFATLQHTTKLPLIASAALLPTLLFCSCITPKLPAFETASPGWHISTGQAVWTPAPNTNPIAGDYLIATHPDGRVLIDFSKGSLSVASVRTTPTAWRIEIPSQNRRIGSRGLPPARSSWLVLARDQAGFPPPKPWTFTTTTNQSLLLQSTSSGESLELYPALP